MASITEFLATANALTGVAGEVGTLNVLRIPYVRNLSPGVNQVVDGSANAASITVAGSPTYTDYGGPDYTAGGTGGNVGGPFVTFNGTTQGLDLGKLTDTSAINTTTLGLYGMFVVRHTSTAAIQHLIGSYDATTTNGYGAAFNRDAAGSLVAHKFSIDRADLDFSVFYDEWALSAQDTILSQNQWSVVEFYIVRNATSLAWYNKVNRVATTAGGASGVLNASATQKTIIGGYAVDTAVTYNCPMDFQLGMLMRGKPTYAQRKSLFDSLFYNSYGLSRVQFDVNGGTGALLSGVETTEGQGADTLVNLNLDREDFTQSTSAQRPTKLIASNNNVPTLNFFNSLQSGAFGADTVRQAMVAASISGINASAQTMVGTFRLAAGQILGATNQNLFELFTGGTTVVGSLLSNGVSNAIARMSWFDGTSVRTPAALLDSFSGASRVVVGCSISRTGPAASSIRVALQTVSGTAAFTVPWSTALIDTVRLGGTSSGAGNLAGMWLDRAVYSDTEATEAELLSAMAQMYNACASESETLAPTVHVTVFSDSIGVEQQSTGRGWVRLINEAGRVASWRNISVSGFTMGETASNFTATTPNAANKRGGASVTKNIALIYLGTNDYLANNAITAAALDAYLGTLIAAIPGYDRIVVVGLSTVAPDALRNGYQTLINARVGVSITSTASLRSLVGKLNADGIHPNDAGHLQMAEDIWGGGPLGVGGGLRGAAPEFSESGGTRSRNYRSRNYR